MKAFHFMWTVHNLQTYIMFMMASILLIRWQSIIGLIILTGTLLVAICGASTLRIAKTRILVEPVYVGIEMVKTLIKIFKNRC